MKQFLLKIVYRTAYHMGVVGLCYRFRRTPIVLSYHNIIPDDLFDDHQQFIGGDHRLSEFQAHLEIVKSRLSVSNELKPGTVLITFDDGFRNNALIAAPLLEKLDMKATFFVPACYFDGAQGLWVDDMLKWLSFIPDGTYTLAGNSYRIVERQDRIAAWESIWQQLLNDFELKSRLLEDMEKAHSFQELSIDERYRELRFDVLSTDDMEQMKGKGHKIACHSYNHDILSKLSSSELAKNFERCGRFASRYNSNWFSYPFGRPQEVSDNVMEECRTSGYTAAFMNVDQTSGGAFRLPRQNMPNSTDKIVIHAKLSGFELLLKRLLGRASV